MFQHLLVPLDGSPEAEQVLPAVARLARASGARISLFTAVPMTTGYMVYPGMGSYAEQMQEDTVKEVEAYLTEIQQRDMFKDLPVKINVSQLSPAQAITSYALSEFVDLIVMSSHGYTGVERWVMGSVAQKIARHSSIPVLILQKKRDGSGIAQPNLARPLRGLVALDGSPIAEATLEPAAQIVELFNVPPAVGVLHLLRVVQPPHEREERKYQKYDINIREYMANEAEQYLKTVQARLQGAHSIQVETSVVLEHDVATVLIETAETGAHATGQSAQGYDFLAIATHGRGGIQHLMVGSIADRVLERTRVPLLIVRPTEVESTGKPEQPETEKKQSGMPLSHSS